MKKNCLITGVTGQDGSYLAELLLEKKYKVYGMARLCSTTNLSRIEHLLDRIELISGDMGDQSSLIEAIKTSRPDEVYNLAAQSFVGSSWSQPQYVFDVNALGCIRLLDAIREIKPDAKFYQASTSELFGKARETPQKEETPFHPRSPYAVAKAAAYWATVNYRESYGMYACNGILFNHESERRGTEFVTRKITQAVARIMLKKDNELRLGNLEAKRDWGYAPDFVEAMWLMLQQPEPEDFVIATGQTRSVRDFVEAAFKVAKIKDWERFVVQDPKFYRPSEVHVLCGDATKAKRVLKWTPKTSFEDMVEKMVMHDFHNPAIFDEAPSC